MAMASLDSIRGPPLLLAILAFSFTALIPLTLSTTVSSINPRIGSLRGATRITIKGTGFSKDPFSYGNGNEEKGNKVYLRNSTASIECDVLPYWSNTERILCDTRSASAGTYSLLLFVDGAEISTQGGTYCSGRSYRCDFQYSAQRTPYVESATPSSGTPGTLVNIRGRLYTSTYSNQQAAQVDVEDYDPDDELLIQRVYWGDYVCDLTDSDTDEIYGITLDSDSDWGNMIVKPKGMFVESQKIHFLISGSHGRSHGRAHSLKMSGQNKLYHYQTHAEISNVEPSTGSLEGGTTLTISGNYFYALADTTILVSGILCDIQNISDTVIICITNRGSEHSKSTYPGSRGILWERWTASNTNLDTATFDVTGSDYVEPEVRLEGLSPSTIADNYVGRLRGYFVPPRDGEYRLWIRGDDENALYFSDSGNETNLEQICYSRSYSRWFTTFPTQKSDYLSLEGGKAYYLEARVKEHGGGDFVEIGVDFFDVPVAAGVIDSVYNEEQQITVAATVQPELQSIRIVDSYEVQEIRITYDGCNKTDVETGDCDPEEYFYVAYQDEITENMFVFASADELEYELNLLPNIPANCSVVLVDDGLNYTYTITFETTEDMDLLTVQTNDPFLIDVRVSEITAGGAADHTDFVLDYGGVQSSTLSTTSTIHEVQEALFEMFSVGCRRNGNPTAVFSRDYETPLAHGTESGQRVTDVEPFCGRTSLKNPEWLYLEPNTNKGTGTYMDDGLAVNAFRAPKRLCFSFKGKIGARLLLKLRYIHYKQYTQVNNEEWFTFSELQSYSGWTDTWQRECLDLFDAVFHGEVVQKSFGMLGMYVTQIVLPTPSDSQPLFIDNVFIGEEVQDDSYTRTKPPASLDGVLVSDFNVTKNSLGFDIKMFPASCGYGFPLLGFEDAIIPEGSAELDSNMALYRSRTFSAEVTRLQPATVPISGSFILANNDMEVEVSTTTSANQMKEALESFLDTGTVAVHRESNCYKATWEIEWTTKGGRQPLLEINGTGVEGTDVRARVQRLVEGRLFMAPIPGEYLRLPYDEPQVEVMVNHIPSKCAVNGSCAFSYESASTPEIESITPTSGSQDAGTTITISGQRFSDDVSENNVTIGGVVCDVTSASETSLTCDVGPGAYGNYSVVVNVESKGLAAYPDGDVLFEYETDVTGVDPVNGSAVGGTQITISGYGFPDGNDAIDRVMVAVGDKNCRIFDASYDEIVCKIAFGGGSSRRKRSATADVVVSVDNEIIVTGDDLFFFDDSQVLTISDFQPRNSSVVGGGNMTITGLGFGTDGAAVYLGDRECQVLSQSSTEIVCSIPDSSPGSYDLELSVANKGFADPSTIDQFEYLLQVTSVTPDVGSLSGGSRVVITGAGFGTDASEISIELSDTVTCEIETIVDDQIKCIIEVSRTVHVVDNLGKHESWGVGYKWNPQRADVRVGDIVYWQWTVPTYVNGMSYTVWQTANADATDYDGSGFYAGSGSTQGTYAFKFGSPGVYYYSSGAVDGGSFHMRGVVRVSPQPSQAFELALFAGDYEAEYITDSGVTAPSVDGCTPDTTPLENCTTAQPPTDSSNGVFQFAVWDCLTPSITDISPNQGGPATVIQISGYGFGTETCQNQITINDHDCVAQSANETYIECVIDTADTLPVGNYDTVYLNVLGKGDAFNAIISPVGRTFRMVPAITDLSQDQGSQEGGTHLIIYGDGFSAASSDDISVTIGGTECAVEAIEYTAITCVTGKPTSGSGSYAPEITINSVDSICSGNCAFEFTSDLTPEVSNVSPTSVSGESTTINIDGSGFSTNIANVTVTVGGVNCFVTSAAEDAIECDVGYVPVGDAPFIVNIEGAGNSAFTNPDHATLYSDEVIDSMDPVSGSLQGGQEITIIGSGFHDDDTTVDIDGSECVIQSVNISEIICITTSHSAGTVDLIVTSGGVNYPAETYDYANSDTPTVTSVSPDTGVTGDSITISGSGFSSADAENTVTIDGVECSVTSSGASSLDCDVGVHAAGTYTVVVHVQGKGYASSSEEFEYTLEITSVSPAQGSFGGGPTLEIDGAGFGNIDDTTVTVCDNVCDILNITESLIECDVPASLSPNSGTEDCDVVVTISSGAETTESNGFQYREDLTPIIDFVDPPRGGTGGGTTLTITGTGFASSGNKVYIAGTACSVNSESTTEIECRTGAHSPSVMTTVRVDVPNKGVAIRENAMYYYVDVWSSKYTWGGLDPPIEGDFVVVPAGQTLLLDTSTPILKMLLIQGGSVIFDEVDLTLNSEYILIMDDGLLQVGTEDEPFQHQATIMMHGNVRSKELPMYGAKTLAVRHGTLDLHGKHIPVTWTYLAETINAGDTTMTLIEPVTWEIGDQIVIAATTHRHSQKENEELTITGVSGDGMTLTFEPAVEFEHISMLQIIDDVTLETRAEVGLLTRNVVVRGSVHSEWTETIEECEAEFDTNQFATQTCFQGRFGEETASDQYGSAIMLFAREPDKHLATGRLSYIEVTHAGQAFRLGRYAIHFHLNGNVTGNYVRGCAIHHTFNRAVTVHAVHYLLVERNVAYNIMGHAYFLEDGIETKNIIQYNLAIFVRSSSSLLNVDVTPASYWITNADNIVRHNNAAGGSHFGFWYRAPSRPEGPSFTNDVCPRNIPVLEFNNNTVHNMGWYGIWIFPVYFPMEGGSCDASKSSPAEYYNLTAWHVERGAEAVAVGNIRFINFLISDATASGVEYQTSWDAWGGPMVKDSVIIAHSDIAVSDSACTGAGVQLPKSKHLTVDGVKFMNFDQDGCAAIRACGHCKPDQGGYQSRFQNIKYYNSPNKARWNWQHECWLEDLDGTLIGESAGRRRKRSTVNYKLLPYNPNLPSAHCKWGNSEFGSDGKPGAVCDDTITFHRMGFNNPLPKSLLYKRAVFINENGVSYINYHKKRLTHPNGWMITLIDGSNYRWFFEDRDHLTNISYNARFEEFNDGQFVLMNHNFTQKPDAFALTGAITNGTEEVPSYDSDNHGDWNFDNNTKVFTYLISGKGRTNADLSVNLDVYRCYYKDCIPPVPDPPPEVPDISTNSSSRPSNVSLWSDVNTWKDLPPGWGGNTGDGSYSGALPEDGQDVMIMPGTYVVADTALPVMRKLFIYGTLELDDSQDFNITATYILIQGGRLIIGWSEDEPFTHNVHILLEGNHFTEDIPLPNGPNLGSKAIGSFGGLDLHGRNRSVYTHLATPVSAGDDTIVLEEDTDWEEGDEIMVTTTTYEPWHTETFRIQSVTDARTFVLNSTFEYTHLVGEHTVTDGEVVYNYGLKAKVALLTRNIKIEGAEYPDLIEESFGARLIVGRFFQDKEMYLGYGRISNVEFYHSGQEGWTDFYDPRYSIAFLDTGPSVGETVSYVTGCSFHQGFASAIGTFGAMGVLIKDNVIHHTVGSAVIDYGVGNQFINNLVSVVINPGTYLDRREGENLIMPAGFEMDSATSPILINNTVAGSEKFGFSIKGEPCDEDSSWNGNTVHSTWMGVALMSNLPGCSKVANFEIYKCANHGIFALISSSLHITNVIMADNKVGITPLIFSPPALSHIKSNKFVRIENSLIVAMSPDYDCGGDDDKTPQAAGLPKSHPTGLAPGGGHVGIKWTSFMSGRQGAPFKPFDKPMSYPAIGGTTYVDNVMFANFQTTCNKQHKIIMTNNKNEDCQHPIETSNIRLVNVDNDNILKLHRPNLGSVNPSDCVDMDCDGMKKALIRDLDGTLLGSAGTIISDSAFQWGKDKRRGLGDYRIPPVMVTELDGSRIAYEDKLPNKGIFRGRNNECEWKNAWTAYECHGIDHMMMVVESLDADTEVRRLSPVALYSDSYVDLINGPQDNGWCLGYTCQERISTFYTIVATGNLYEMVFSGTNPQRLRYNLLNSDDTQKLVVGTWYANPQRLDVYVDGKYIMPNNGAIENGEFVWKNDLAPEEYIPDPSSNVYGENFFHRDLATLYINIRGSLAVDVVTTPVVMVTFGVPAITVDEFFEENLINNLVQFLDVEPSQIRIVEIIAEDSKRRRRAASEAEVVLEIGDAPADTIETQDETSTGTPATTNAPPSTTASSATSSSGDGGLSFDSLVSIQSTLANEMQQGNLGDALDVQITSLAMTDPADTPVDPTGGVKATNETAGPANGTATYAEQQAAEEAEEEADAVVAVVYRIPTQLVILTEPSGAVEGEMFTAQPQVQVLDALGIPVTQLGTTSNPWQLTASIRSGSGSVYGDLLGNTTLPFTNGWVNFTDLVIDSAESDYILDFHITYPNTSSLTVSSQSFAVEGREYYAAVVTAPDMVNVSDSFDVIVEIRDGETMSAVTDLAEKGFVWQAMASFPTVYQGQLIGDIDVTFDLATAQAQFSNLSINATGYQYIVEIQVITVPSSAYDFSVQTEPFDVRDPAVVIHTGPASSLTITFNADYDAIVLGQENVFISTFLNYLAPLYPNVTITNVAVSKGSIIVTFDIQGDVNGTQDVLAQDIEDGNIILSFDGNTLPAGSIMLANGNTVINPQATTVIPGTTTQSSEVTSDGGDGGDGGDTGSGSSGFPIWVVAVVVVIAIAMVAIIILVVCKLMNKTNSKISSSDMMPLQESPREKMRLESVASFQNQGFETPDFVVDSSSCSSDPLTNSDPELQRLTDDVKTTRDLSVGFESAEFRVPSPNTPRRTPEVEVVTALPPGFSEEQEERVLEDRQKMYLMAKNQDGTFLKLGTISANRVGTVFELRQDIMSILSPDLKSKKFMMMKETLKDIDGSLEKKLSVSEIYSSDCVLIRFVNENDESKMCVCGLMGQFDCSLCHKQKYCSPGCQSKDWPRHTIVCSQWSTKE